MSDVWAGIRRDRHTTEAKETWSLTAPVEDVGTVGSAGDRCGDERGDRAPALRCRRGMSATAHVPAVGIPAAAVAAAALLARAVALEPPPCRADPDAWYDAATLEAAREGCRGCPHLAPCHDYAAAAGERYGVWAGIDRGRRCRAPTATRARAASPGDGALPPSPPGGTPCAYRSPLSTGHEAIPTSSPGTTPRVEGDPR